MVDNHGGTIIKVNNSALLKEVKKSVKTVEESLKSLQNQIGACEHFKLKLDPDTQKSLLLLEKSFHNILN